MTWRTALLSLVISSGFNLFPAAFASAEDEPPPRRKPVSDVTSCAKVTASTRYEAYGYTHVVELKNACPKAVFCQVWTDVDSTKLPLKAEPGKTESVVTRKGSPSRAVVAQSECTLEK